jgi:hypothetical protein
MALHQAMISTIERLSGHAGILSLTCQQLLGHITVMFGSLRATDVFYIENHIKEELKSFAAFRDFISRNSLNYDILHKIPHPISDITKIHWLENSLQRCPQFDIPIGTWKSLNTNSPHDRTSPSFSTYRPNTRPCRPTHLLVAAKPSTQQMAQAQQTRDKAVNASVTAAKAKAPATARVLTSNGSRSNNKHHKRTPPLQPPRNNYNSASSGTKKFKVPWPANCTNGLPAPRLSPQPDLTPALSGGLKRPRIVSTA